MCVYVVPWVSIQFLAGLDHIISLFYVPFCYVSVGSVLDAEYPSVLCWTLCLLASNTLLCLSHAYACIVLSEHFWFVVLLVWHDLHVFYYLIASASHPYSQHVFISLKTWLGCWTSQISVFNIGRCYPQRPTPSANFKTILSMHLISGFCALVFQHALPAHNFYIALKCMIYKFACMPSLQFSSFLC